MITKTDAINTVDFDDYYVIMPSTQTLHGEKFINESGPNKGKMCHYGFSYDSGTNDDFLTVQQLEKLIEQL